jgi:hypothetical protein
MAKDPILDELHKTRERYAARFKNDLNAIFRDLKAKEEEGQTAVVNRPPRRPQVKQSLKKRPEHRGAA